MATKDYRKETFEIVYVDPTIGTAGDGSTPANALQDLPDLSTLTTATAFIIRRTAETSGVTKPTTNVSGNVSVMFLGMPKAYEAFYSWVPDDAKTAWDADTADKAVMFKNDNTTVLLDSYTVVICNMTLICTGDYGGAYFDPRMEWVNPETFMRIENILMKSSLGRIADQTAEFVAGYYPGLFTNNLNDGNNMYAYNIMVKNVEADLASSAFLYTLYKNLGRHFIIEDCVFNTASGCSVFVVSHGQQDDNEYDDLLRINNVIMNIFINGNTSTETGRLYTLGTRRSANNDGLGLYKRAELCNININTDAPVIGSFTGTSYQMSNIILHARAHKFLAENININLSKVWGIKPADGYSYSGVDLHRASWRGADWAEALDGYIKNFSLTMAETGGLGDPPTYEAVDSIANYAVNLFGFTMDTVTVEAPRAGALYVVGCNGNNITVKGALRVYGNHDDNSANVLRSTLNIAYLGSYYPHKQLMAYDGCRLYIDNLEYNKSNPDVPYAGEPAFYQSQIQGSLIFVNQSNVPLFGSDLLLGGDRPSGAYIVSFSDTAAGNFRMRSNNQLLETWNVTRDGNNCLRFTQYDENVDWLILGNPPYKGIMSTPPQTGQMHVKIYIAYKNYFDMTMFYPRLKFEIRVPQSDANENYEIITIDNSDIMPEVDTASTYANDTDLTQLVYTVPIDIKTVNKPVILDIHARMYAANGYTYIDPNIEYVTP